MSYIFEPGDVILTGGKAWISRAIRWITSARNEERTIKNHAGIGIDNKNYIEALTTVKKHTYSHLLNLNTHIEIWRNKELNNEQKEIISKKSLEYLGRLYGAQKIVLHALDGLLGKVWINEVYLFRRLGFMDRYPICSWVVSYAYDEIGYKFKNRDPKFATPDCIHDCLVENKEWIIVYTNHNQQYTENKLEQ